MQRMPVLVATNARGGAHCIKFSVTHHAMATKWSRSVSATSSAPPSKATARRARRFVACLHRLKVFDEDVRGQLPEHGCLSCSSRPLLATDGFLCNWRRAVTFLVHSRIVERVSRTCSTSFVSWGFFTNEAAGTGLAVMPRGHSWPHGCPAMSAAERMDNDPTRMVVPEPGGGRRGGGGDTVASALPHPCLR